MTEDFWKIVSASFAALFTILLVGLFLKDASNFDKLATGGATLINSVESAG